MKKSFISSSVASRPDYSITEREILTLKARINRDAPGVWDDVETLFDHYTEPLITEEQSEKGLAWLLNQWKTPAGRVRKNNPFGERETEIISNFSYFTLEEFANVGRHFNYFVPVYCCYDKFGNSFSYYVNGGRFVLSR